jgi:hypothetical protein
MGKLIMVHKTDERRLGDSVHKNTSWVSPGAVWGRGKGQETDRGEWHGLVLWLRDSRVPEVEGRFEDDKVGKCHYLERDGRVMDDISTGDHWHRLVRIYPPLLLLSCCRFPCWPYGSHLIQFTRPLQAPLQMAVIP